LIYLDTSVALAHLLGEARRPPVSLWKGQIVSSRLLEYELWVRIRAYGLISSHSESVAALLRRIHLLEMVPLVLSRALDPFPTALRTLDALHLASAEFVRRRGEAVEVASYDGNIVAAAAAMGFPLADV
jgi:predicted nucleic acid-binding protein